MTPICVVCTDPDMAGDPGNPVPKKGHFADELTGFDSVSCWSGVWHVCCMVGFSKQCGKLGIQSKMETHHEGSNTQDSSSEERIRKNILLYSIATKVPSLLEA